ncbi:MAG: C25 family cysteine peptidase [Bacteroidota bacterium]
MKKYLFSLLAVILFSSGTFAQMVVQGDTLYGNEWINYEQDYVKFNIAEEGVFRVDRQTLLDTGADLSNVDGANFQMYHLGQEIPIFVSNSGDFGNSDFIEFYGQKYLSELDYYLVPNPDQLTNPYYSLFTDTSAYFLTWNNSTANSRLEPTANDLTNLPAAEPFFMYEHVEWYNNKHLPGFVQNDLTEARIVIGQGWSTGYASVRTLNVPLSAIFASGPDATIDMQIFSGIGAHQLQVDINSTTVINEVFNNFRLNEYTVSMAAGNLTESMQFDVEGVLDNDLHSVAYITIDYPRTFDFAGASMFNFELPASNNPVYLDITNFDVTGSNVYLYDRTNGLSIQTQVSGSNVQVKLPASAVNRELVLINRASSIEVTTDMINTVQFRDYNTDQGDFIIVSNQLLYDDGNGNNFVQGYADYRGTTGFSPIIIEVQELFDQFGYGVNRQSMAFRNFSHFAVRNWDQHPPEYLFIIGKARGYVPLRNNPAVNYPIEKVPTYGNGADNLLTASVLSDVPIIPIGRLAAFEGSEVGIYLDKVMAFEGNQTLPQTIEDKAWMKRIIHLGGGDANIQTQIRVNLNSYKDIIEAESYGGNVFSFFKTSTDPIQISQSDFLDSLINDGSSMITFFGHSSPNSFDFNLDLPENYTNFERYPLIFSLGCFTGNIFKKTKGLSEDFVIIEDKGAIGFLASTQLASFGSLNLWGDRFYRNVSTLHYEEGIGKSIQAVIASLDNSSYETRRLNQFMSLHGDPAVSLNSHEAPDYLVKGTATSFEPSLITTQLDSFDINVTITNIGEAVPDSFDITITRELPDGTLINAVNERVESPEFESSFSFTLPVRDDALGLNQFCITADAVDDIGERPLPDAENNNTYCLNQYILSDDVLPVHPYPFAIVPENTPTLKASTANTFAGELEYFMEIDTTELFNSPIKISTSIVQAGGTLEWTPNVDYQNETVYYWRVQVNPDLVPNSSGWKTSSFIYIQDEFPGWNQSHFYQFQKDDYINMRLKPNREFSFIEDFLELTLDLSYPGILVNDQIAFYINGSKQYHFGFCGNLGVVNFAVFDPVSGEPWINNPDGLGGIYGSTECRPLVPNFAYPVTNMEGRQKAIDFLRDTVPDGFYVLAYTYGDYSPQNWTSDSLSVGDVTLFSVFEELGATQLRSMQGSPVPYSAFMRKGNPAFAQEQFAASTADVLNSVYQLPGSWNNGYVESPAIGPAADWSQLLWNFSALDGMAQNDNVYIDVIGLDANENQTILATGITDMDTTLNFVNPEQYPFIKLRFNAQDVINETSAQLDFWRVIFEEIPDAALRPEILFTLDNDTIQQGRDLTMQIAIENLTNADMDSLLIKYIISDDNNNELVQSNRMAPLLGGESLVAELLLPTRDLAGSNRIFIEANPDDDQLERFHFNNIALVDFNVTRDVLNPILDVTFDGKHIMEGDIVSARPNILITLKDENKYLELGDTSLFKILLQYPGEAGLRQVHFDSDEMTFYPADPSNLGDENRAVIELNPSFLVNGTYQLFVQAEDATGNQSGDLDYKVAFEVINEASISNVLNYPNPFTTSTRFVFTLTGAELPEFMKIQIMTVTGKVVREIMMDELGPISIGNNITDYAWDGTDQYGDRLANGVYLYRVITHYNGEEMQRYQNNTNQYFKEGIGKMYLMR